MFQKKMDPRGYNWKVISSGLKDDWFQEYKKLYTWHAEHETLVKHYWTKLTRRRYSDLCSKVIKPCRYGTKSELINEVDWSGWLEYWKTLTVENNNATKNSKNRLSEVAGPGTGPSKHTCGSKSAVSHMLDMKRGGVQPPLYEVQRKIYTSKKTG